MDPGQSRAARALLSWSQPQLASNAGVSISTIRDFETGKRQPIANNLAAIRATLENAGVIILDDGQCVDGGPGVRLRKPGPPNTHLPDGEAGIIENNEM